jgi:fatty-acyl-CoA synthase
VIVPKPGTSPSERELIDLVKLRKGSTHAPKQVKFVNELPMTGVGKVDKKALRAKFWVGRERMVG